MKLIAIVAILLAFLNPVYAATEENQTNGMPLSPPFPMVDDTPRSVLEPTIEENITKTKVRAQTKVQANLHIIHLLRIIKRDLKKGQITGSGYAALNNGASYYFWNSSTPPQIDISWRKKLLSDNCSDILSNDTYPKQIVAYGTFLGTGSGGRFKLQKFLDCSAGTEIKDQNTEEIFNRFSAELLKESEKPLVR